MRYLIPGIPIPLQRHRHNQFRCYDSQSKIKKDLQYVIKAQHGKLPLYEPPLYLSIEFYFPLPKRKSKSRTYIQHYCKPDLSNLIKFVEDVCNKILYKDDSLISHINALKLYDTNARTEFYILSLQNNDQKA